MNENPGGMPNPLNPNPMAGPEPNSPPLDTNPSEPITPVGMNEVITENIATTTETSSINGQMSAQPGGITTSETITISSFDPTGRPMEKVPEVVPEPPKKKKTGLIIGIIVGAVALIGIIVAVVIVILNMNQGDAVSRAMNKIMSGKAPTNVAVDGTIKIVPTDTSAISEVNIEFNSELMASSLINASTATVTITASNGESASLEFDETYAANGDLYFKLDGISNISGNNALLNGLFSGGSQTTYEVRDCTTDEFGDEKCTDEVTTIVAETTDCSGESGCVEVASSCTGSTGDATNATGCETYDPAAVYANTLSSVAELIDGEWLRISVDELGEYSGLVPESSEASCVANLVQDVNKYSNSTAELYSKNPFIKSVKVNTGVSSRQYPVYQVSVDSEKFANFVNSIQNSEMSSGLYNCLGLSNNLAIGAEDVASALASVPNFYVEVDNNDNFTRLYFDSTVNNGSIMMTASLNFSYPLTIDVPEPLEYQDFSNVIQTVFSSMVEVEPQEAEAQE